MKKTYLLAVLLGLILSCGGEDPAPIDSLVSKWLVIAPPASFTDNTPLIPKQDLKYWKIYAKNIYDNSNNGWFSEEDEVVDVNAIDTAGEVVVEFKLNNLKTMPQQKYGGKPLPLGEYAIRVKTQTMDGETSTFSDNEILWENN